MWIVLVVDGNVGRLNSRDRDDLVGTSRDGDLKVAVVSRYNPEGADIRCRECWLDAAFSDKNVRAGLELRGEMDDRMSVRGRLCWLEARNLETQIC